MDPLVELNGHQLETLFEEAEDFRRNSLLAIRNDNQPLALVYATLYQAQNVRIRNFFTELAFRGEQL